MEAVELNFTTEQQSVFDDFCSLLSAPRRRELAERYNSRDQHGTDIKTLSIKQGNQDVKVFEAYHIIDFYKKTKENYAFKNAIIGEFKGRTKKPKTEGEITKIASEDSYSRQATEEIFRILARARNSSLPECFLDFLKFCEKNGFPIRCFESLDHLQNFILDLESHISSMQNLDALSKSTIANHNQSLSINNGFLLFTSKAGDFELTIPDNTSSKNVNNVASILTWDCHLTSLIGRESELTELYEWAESDPEKSIKILSGEGGIGKTRLAFHVAKELKSRGWSAGQPLFDEDGVYTIGSQGILLIIDYPEDKVDYVSTLLMSLRSLDVKETKIRVLLLSRNTHFADSISDNCQHLFSAPLTLAGLEKSGWELFSQSWHSIQLLDGEKNHQPPITEADFNEWLNQDNSFTRPLMILAMAFYLFHEPSAATETSKVSSNAVLRYITKKEISRVKNEVASYSKFNDKIEFQSVCLLIAVAAIPNGLDDALLRSIHKKISTLDVDFPAPPVKHIKQLSLWCNDKIPALTPDLLAADFLAYCIDQYAENQEFEWLSSVLFQKYKSDKNYAIHINLNFTRFNRLVHDFEHRLGFKRGSTKITDQTDITLQDFSWRNVIEKCLNALKEHPEICSKISKYLNGSSSAITTAFLKTASMIAFQNSSDPDKKLLALMDISHAEFNKGNYLNVIELYKKALDVSDLNQNIPSSGMRNIIGCGLNAIKSHALLNQKQEGISLAKDVYLLINPKLEEKPSFTESIASIVGDFHYSLALCYSGTDSNRCLLLLNEASEIFEKLIKESPQTTEYKKNCAHIYHAISCELYHEHTDEKSISAAKKYLDLATKIMGQLAHETPLEFGQTYLQFKAQLDGV